MDILFPIKCLGCKKEGQWLCDDCLSSIDEYSYLNPLLKKAIHTFKYNFVKDLAKPLGKLLIRKLGGAASPDLIIPVPLHKRKLRWRGFNQAELLAQEVAAYYNLPLLNNVLIKTKRTKPQVELTEEQRKENIKGVFQCSRPELIKNKKILLIDDVATTGSTLSECARVLKEAGAKEVRKLFLAKT